MLHYFFFACVAKFCHNAKTFKLMLRFVTASPASFTLCHINTTGNTFWARIYKYAVAVEIFVWNCWVFFVEWYLLPCGISHSHKYIYLSCFLANKFLYFEGENSTLSSFVARFLFDGNFSPDWAFYDSIADQTIKPLFGKSPNRISLTNDSW